MSTMFTKSSIKDTENKHDVYKGKDCLKKKNCKSLTEHERKIISF